MSAGVALAPILAPAILAVIPLVLSTTSTSSNDQPLQNFNHGTSVESGLSLLKNAPLDAAVAASKKMDGPEGFYLATDPIAAEYFAYRRSPGTILQYSMTTSTIATLTAGGAQIGRSTMVQVWYLEV